MIPIKILWHSVAPWVGSGYGQQTATFTKRIHEAGHDVAISAYYGLAGAKLQWQGMTCYPAYAKQYGTDMIVPHAIDHFGGGPGKSFREVADSGLIITLGDVWTFRAPLLADMNVASWVPVDHETVPPVVAGWFEFSGAVPIAMSRFGEQALRDVGLNPLYVPHGIDTSIFCPGDQAEARKRVGIPEDAFVVTSVAANVGRDGSRKAFYEQIVAFAEFRRRHPEAVLALHTDVKSEYGVDIMHLLADFPESSYFITDQYGYKVGQPPDVVADIMRASDLLTNTSWGEGFGIPIVEAQACGTPVVVTDTTAMPELCGAGWKVAGEPLWHDSQHAWARKPYIVSILNAYEEAYAMKATRPDEWLALRARAHAFAQDYDADHVMEAFWKPALVRLESAMDRATKLTEQSRTVSAEPTVKRADGLFWYDRGRGYGDSLGWQDHEKELKPIITELLPQGGVFVDVGAHVGHYTLRLASRASQVYAVEANPDTMTILRKNLHLNEIGNVYTYQFAAWDSDTRLALSDPNKQQGGGSTRTVTTSESGVFNIPAHRLDDVFDHVDRIDLIKFDVEGADLVAIEGARGLLERHEPVLFIECHDYAGYYDRADLEALLTDLGYTWEIAFSYDTHWHPDGPLDSPVRADYLICHPRVE